MVVRRLIDVKGFHTGTEIDIKSGRLAKVLQEINPDVEGVSLTALPVQVSNRMYWDHFSDALIFSLSICLFNNLRSGFRHQRSFSTTTGSTFRRGWTKKRRQTHLTMAWLTTSR